MIEFEAIKAWDGLSDSGKDVRLKIDRNFAKVLQEFLSVYDIIESEGSSIKSNGSVLKIVVLTQAEYDAIDIKSETTLYFVTDGDVTTIEDLLLELQSDLDSKADSSTVNEALQILTTALSGKASTGDLTALAESLTQAIAAKATNTALLTAIGDSIGAIHPAAEAAPAEGISRRYRYTLDGNCNFVGVKNELTDDVLEVPFPVKKDDELQVVFLAGAYTYRYYPFATKEATARYNADQDIINIIGEIGTVLDILNGDVEGNIDDIINEMLGV